MLLLFIGTAVGGPELSTPHLGWMSKCLNTDVPDQEQDAVLLNCNVNVINMLN